jgi:hypothetical protein
MSDLARTTSLGAESGAPVPQAVEAVWLLVHALERLEARIHRDLHSEAADVAPPADPAWAATLSDFSRFAEECLGALADPRVRSVLETSSPPPRPR